jgi:hypothetical protein
MVRVICRGPLPVHPGCGPGSGALAWHESDGDGRSRRSRQRATVPAQPPPPEGHGPGSAPTARGPRSRLSPHRLCYVQACPAPGPAIGYADRRSVPSAARVAAQAVRHVRHMRSVGPRGHRAGRPRGTVSGPRRRPGRGDGGGFPHPGDS